MLSRCSRRHASLRTLTLIYNRKGGEGTTVLSRCSRRHASLTPLILHCNGRGGDGTEVLLWCCRKNVRKEMPTSKVVFTQRKIFRRKLKLSALDGIAKMANLSNISVLLIDAQSACVNSCE